MCHRYRGLARVDKKDGYRLFFVDEHLYNRGPHARLNCRSCHDDINQIPHNDAKPVNCLKSCHIEEPNREILFSHKGVDRDLSGSVHGAATPGGTPRPHPEDFPTCKTCHDEPLFRPVALHKHARPGVSEQAVSRCKVCHKDERFIRYYYSHVTSRMHKSRDSREVIAMCGSCHADPEFARRHKLPDVIASYFDTYHGKAVALGSTRAPDCLDCHVHPGDGVHAMLPKTDGRSSVHPDNKLQTCSTTDCHPNASPNLASFHVHAERHHGSYPLEFFVALFFVVMTLAVLLPILTVNVLTMLRDLFPSREAKESLERLVVAAEAKAGDGTGLMRFSVFQRVKHAMLVISFVVLCLTGFPMRFPHASWARVIQLFGGIETAPIIHRIAGVTLIIGFVFHLVTIAIAYMRQARQTGKGPMVWIRCFLGLPMIPNLKDAKDILQSVKYLLYLSPHRPNYGRFSWKEKLEYLGLLWGTTLLGITGILLWGEELYSPYVPGWALNVAYLAHTYESFLAAVHICLVHIPGIIGKPGGSPITGMFVGWISPHVQADEHGAELELDEPAPAVDIQEEPQI
jgi:cytochrome b subunit of formate dehydrogenase